MSWQRPPYIKGKGYNVNPVVTKGIPKEADSRNYPNVWGTPAWEQWWLEQIYYIHNGYQIGGLWVPGRYYYYMNFIVMNTIERGAINPDNTDLHLEIAYFIEYCKKNGKNGMMPKGRRRGVSEASHPMIIDYGYRFSPEKYQGGVAAGHSVPINDFMTKWEYAQSQLPPELYIGTLTHNDKEIIAGWQQKNDLNAWQDYGSFNTVYTRTMGSDPNMFKGLFLNDVVVEELGEFEEFLEFWSATKDCLMSNQKQIGSGFCYGTGGRVDKGSKGFKEAWERDANRDWCKANNFERFVIDARRFYYYGDASLEQQRLPLESELFKHYKPYQLIGVEDIELAEADIKRRRKEFLDSGNLKAYNEFVQNNPINEFEIFRKTAVNNFDTAILNLQREEILRMDHVPYVCYKPEYIKDEKTGMVKQPLQVKMVPLADHEDQSVSVKILDIDGHPKRNFTNRYCAGIDSYNIDESKSSKSLGGMTVYDRHTHTPVAIIRCRPRTKEMFFDLCLKTSLYYGMHNNVLGDIASDTIMKTFELAGAYGMLADRPKKFESLNSQQSHSKWVRLTPFAKEQMVGLMQFHVNHHIKNIKFVELIDEILSYDEESKDSDNDLADAYGMALMQHISYEVAPRNEEENQVHDRFDIPQFVSDGQGGVRLKGNSGGPIRNIQQDENLMKQMFGGHIT